jgi:putative ABC transport system ATP-binding protein
VAVVLDGISRTYDTGAGRIEALKALNAKLSRGEFVGLIGPSGSGKSTLLNLIGGIDRPSSGRVAVDDEILGDLSETRLAGFRGANIGIVFQFFQLVPTLTVLENLRIAMDLVGVVPARERNQRSLALLDQVGVLRHKGKLPSRLSGGEQQRVAVARALANDPAIVVADEPTGNLDRENSDRLMDLFGNCAAQGRLVVVATHDRGQLDRFSRVLTLTDGALISDEEVADYREVGNG